MQLSDKRKQKEFMTAYQPIHDNFVRFCKARSHKIMGFDDLINESVLKAYQHWSGIEKKESLLYFLFTTATNIVRNTIRKRSEERLDGIELKMQSTEKSVYDDLEIQYLYEQLDKLSDHKKEALILFEISGFSIREIAKIQDSTEGAVKVLLSRSRKELRELMADEPFALAEEYSETVN